MNPKIVFFGTQNFGAGILRCLIDSGKYDLVAVVAQPDRKIGRMQKIQKSPVKILAEQQGLHVLQPESLKDWKLSRHSGIPFAVGEIGNLDLSIVCEYGLIIPKTILELPKHGFINIHTSLLPKYRGASPIQTAIINGETETGVTIMQMDEKMDRGPILSQEKVRIAPDDTYLNLADKMLPVAQNLLLKTLSDYRDGKIIPIIQDESAATFCKMFTREAGKINWQKSTAEIYNRFRGLTPWPGVWTTWGGKRLKLLVMRPAEVKLAPGDVRVVGERIFIGTSNGAVEILSLQLEGKNAQTSAGFVIGYRNLDGGSLK